MNHKKATQVPPIIFTTEPRMGSKLKYKCPVKLTNQIRPAYLKLLKILFIFMKYSFFLQGIVLFLLEWVSWVK